MRMFLLLSSIGYLPPVSAFAILVDRLRDKSETELKVIDLQFFKQELADEWKDITTPADISAFPEEDNKGADPSIEK